MAFAFMDISKIKTNGQLNSKYIHNCRKISIDNVIPELTENNETLVELPVVSGKHLNYNEAFKNRLDSLDYYKDHNIRKNAVLGYEVLLTFSKDTNIDLELWKKQSVEWLHKTFDVAPDNKSNVLHAEYHADEVGNVHIHAFVVPIDERGRLNAKRFTDGSRAMSDLQSSYAESVQNLGLQRGVAGSSAKHQDIRKMYANLNNAMVLPNVMPNESAEEYRERVEEQVKTAFAAGMKRADDYLNEKRRELDEEKNNSHEALERELKKWKKVHQKSVREVDELQTTMKDKILSYEEMSKLLSEQMYEIKQEIMISEEKLDKNKETEKAVDFYNDMMKGLAAIRTVDPDKAEDIQKDMDYVQYMAEMYDAAIASEEAEKEQEELEEEMENYDI